MDYMSSTFYKALSPNLPLVSSTLPPICPKVRRFCPMQDIVLYMMHPLEGVRNTTTVFDRPARERVRLVSDWCHNDDQSLTYLTNHSPDMCPQMVFWW
jgi:hypothetical protein